jgi:hypothetical protein
VSSQNFNLPPGKMNRPAVSAIEGHLDIYRPALFTGCLRQAVPRLPGGQRVTEGDPNLGAGSAEIGVSRPGFTIEMTRQPVVTSDSGTETSTQNVSPDQKLSS